MLLFKCSDEKVILIILLRRKPCIAYLNFMLDRLFCETYILYLLGEDLVQINKIVRWWLII